jgi:diacylglycerol kinase (ATP)
MPQPRSLLQSLRDAMTGLGVMVTTERNARIHAVAALLVGGLAALLRLPVHDWRWLILAVALVWIAEAMNTAIESLCDIVSTEQSPAMGRVKDVAAGGVLIAALAAAAIGISVFMPYLFATTV